MRQAEILVEVHRGPFLESAHFGHAVICDDRGQIVKAWGDENLVTLPRSSVKMIQALPLITSGAAEAYGLTDRHLALSCASHQGAAVHTDFVSDWLTNLDLGDSDLRCGPQMPEDKTARTALIKGDNDPCQWHNNCSGKHSGFLTLSKHLKAGPEYIVPDHPVQKATLEAFEMTTGAPSHGFGIDGCSAPNFAARLVNIAKAMAWFASSAERSDIASIAAFRLVGAMRANPLLVAGVGRACTELMEAMDGRVAIKTGAEGFFTAILPKQKLGIALKITDGSARASACAMATLLAEVGVLERSHPAAQKYLKTPILNRRGIVTGHIRGASVLTL